MIIINALTNFHQSVNGKNDEICFQINCMSQQKPTPDLPIIPHQPEIKPAQPERPAEAPRPEIKPETDPKTPVKPIEIPPGREIHSIKISI